MLIFRQRARDASEHEHARLSAKLQESERRLRLIAENIDDVIWSADIEINENFYISQSYERIWKRSVDSLLRNPRSFVEAIHPDDRERVLTRLDVANKVRGIPFDHEYRILLPDGSTRWIWDRGFPIRDKTGQVVRYVGIAQDITRSKLAEEQIHALNQDLEKRVSERSAELSATVDTLQIQVEEQRQAEIRALDLADRLKNMTRRLGQAQENERRRLAVELHDGVCSNLTAIGLDLDHLRRQLSRVDLTEIERRLSLLVSMIDEAKRSANNISVDLRPLLRENRDLRSALEDYGQKFWKNTGINVEFKGQGSDIILPGELKIALFRIVQEALTNCAKHADSQTVVIEFGTGENGIYLSIADDGVGFDPGKIGTGKSGMGLLSMQERAESIGFTRPARRRQSPAISRYLKFHIPGTLYRALWYIGPFCDDSIALHAAVQHVGPGSCAIAAVTVPPQFIAKLSQIVGSPVIG